MDYQTEKTERNAEIVRRVMDGETFDHVAGYFGISKQRAHQIFTREIRARPKRVTIEQRKNEIATAYASGEPMIDISKRLHISVNSIYHYVTAAEKEKRRESIECRKRAIFSDVLNGMKLKDVQRKYGISYSYIRLIMGQQYYADKKVMREARNKAILALYCDGKCVSDIAKELDIDPYIVYSVVRKSA